MILKTEILTIWIETRLQLEEWKIAIVKMRRGKHMHCTSTKPAPIISVINVVLQILFCHSSLAPTSKYLYSCQCCGL